MTIGSVVTHGFGAPGSAALVVTRGYSAGVAVDSNPYYTADPPRELRVDFYNNLTGAKLNVPPLTNAVILGCNYQHKIGTIGTFTLQVAADAPAAQNAISGRRIWIYDGNYPVFKGVIRTREISVTSDGKLVLTLVGPSIADQLIGLTTGRGLVFEDDSLTTVVTSLVADTDFDPGSIDTATITARRFDGRTKWDALVATAQAVDCSIREDILPATPLIDMGIFGTSTGITLRNFPQSSEGLSANPYMKQIASLKVKAQSLDLCNRVVPWGQLDGLGGSQLNLGYVAPGNTALTTRLYMNRQDNEAVIAPATDTGWEGAPAGTRWLASTDRGSVNIPEQKQTGTSATDQGLAQFIYGPLGAQTLGGTVKGQFIAVESNAACNATLQMSVRVVSADGLTFRGTALAHGTYGNEANTSNRNLTFPATALSAVDVQAGDYLVIEVGFRKAATFTASLYIGNSGTVDLPEDETTTDITYLPWIEFSQYIALGTEIPSGLGYEVQTGTGPDGNPYYYIEDTDSQAIYGVRERWVQFKDILPLGLTNLDFAAAATTLYGMAVTYLTRHLEEQVAYEVEVMALRHVNPDNGLPYFKVGDTFRLQFDGWTQDNNGQPISYLDVDTDLYVLDFTVTYDAAGTPIVKLTLSTFLRALPTDGEAFRALAQAVGIEQVAPLAFIVFGDGFIRFDPRAIQLATDAANPLAAMYWPGTFTDSPSTTYPRAELNGYGTTSSAIAQIYAYMTATTYAQFYAYTGISSNPQTVLKSVTPTYSAGIETVARESAAIASMKLLGELYQGITTLASLGADVNDYDVGAAYRSAVALQGSAARNITGILATNVNDGALLFITNVGAFNLTLKDASASSAAANRLALNGDIILTPDGGCILQYSLTSQVWRALTKP